jgi:hypothetical protein
MEMNKKYLFVVLGTIALFIGISFVVFTIQTADTTLDT